MINVTESARQGLASFFGDKEVRPIRIHLANGNLKSRQLLLALDDQCSGDQAVTCDNFTFIINKRLAECTGDLYIDKTSVGFSINSEKPIVDDCGIYPKGGSRGCGG